MSRLKVLMACMNHWSSPHQVGSHHLARGFLKAGWEVAFISSPISPLHSLKGGPDLRERRAVHREGGRRLFDGRLWTYVPGALLTPRNTPLLRSAWLHRHWHRLTWPDVVDVAVRNGFGSVDLLYLDNPGQAFWMTSIVHRKSVLRVADNSSGFSALAPAARALEGELARSVDAVVYTALTLEPHVRAMRPKSLRHLPNGVDFKHFSEGPRDVPEDLRSIPRPIAIYVGAVEEWFDAALLDLAAERLPGVSFVVVGHAGRLRGRLHPRPNIHLLGPRPHRDLPRYLHNADVGLIPFDAAGFPALVNSIHPLKLYEYMACGLPVVSVAWEELVRLGTPAVLCRVREEFVQAVSQAVGQPVDRQRLIDFASERDWGRRVDDLIQTVGLELPAGGN